MQDPGAKRTDWKDNAGHRNRPPERKTRRRPCPRDTNTVLAGALAAAKLHVNVGHVETGLRSFDRRIPEELNRVVADHISDYLFAPMEIARANLFHEGIDKKKIFVTGKTIVDAVFQKLEIAQKRGDILLLLGLSHGKYFLVTTHWAENVDEELRQKKLSPP